MPFLSLDLQRDGAPTVFHTVGGVNRLHEARPTPNPTHTPNPTSTPTPTPNP